MGEWGRASGADRDSNLQGLAAPGSQTIKPAVGGCGSVYGAACMGWVDGWVGGCAPGHRGALVRPEVWAAVSSWDEGSVLCCVG